MKTANNLVPMSKTPAIINPEIEKKSRTWTSGFEPHIQCWMQWARKGIFTRRRRKRCGIVTGTISRTLIRPACRTRIRISSFSILTIHLSYRIVTLSPKPPSRLMIWIVAGFICKYTQDCCPQVSGAAPPEVTICFLEIDIGNASPTTVAKLLGPCE